MYQLIYHSGNYCLGNKLDVGKYMYVKDINGCSFWLALRERKKVINHF